MIGPEYILHRNQFPDLEHDEPDEFVRVAIIKQKSIVMHSMEFGPEGQASVSLEAYGEGNRKFFCSFQLLGCGKLLI
ncbi:unnamed protein product, partial [marine sediment metagenome]